MLVKLPLWPQRSILTKINFIQQKKRRAIPFSKTKSAITFTRRPPLDSKEAGRKQRLNCFHLRLSRCIAIQIVHQNRTRLRRRQFQIASSISKTNGSINLNMTSPPNEKTFSIAIRRDLATVRIFELRRQLNMHIYSCV
jgi:hypothetical protein